MHEQATDQPPECAAGTPMCHDPYAALVQCRYPACFEAPSVSEASTDETPEGDRMGANRQQAPWLLRQTAQNARDWCTARGIAY